MFISPFTKLSNRDEKKLTSTIFSILIMALLVTSFFNSQLTNEVASYGIISFELAESVDRSIEIMNSWDPRARIFAGLSLGFDYLFLLIYTLFISLMVHKLNERLWAGKPFHYLGIIILWGMFFAAIFDALENLALIKLLTGSHEQLWSSVAFYFAFIKFFLVIIGILYIVINTIMFLVKKIS